jgi:hypothetical protein
MANISISDLYSDESQSSLISLKETELGLLKTAVGRAIDARQVVGGITSVKLPLPPTIGLIYPSPDYLRK